jgi:O-antigen ligase
MIIIGGTAVLFLVVNNSVSSSRWEMAFEGNVAGRDKIADEAIDMVIERPFFGWNPTFGEELGRRLGLLWEGKDAHNLYLHLLLEVGVVGAFPFFRALWLCGRTAWGARQGALGLLPLALLITTLIGNFARTDLTRKHFWLALAIAAASGPIVSRKAQAARTFPLRWA